jgi:hypothetical protein
MNAVAAFFAGHPARIGGALVVLAAASAAVWYLASPLFVRTYRDEALPSPAAAVQVSGAPSSARTQSETAPTAGPSVVRSGELNYVDAIHNGKGQVRIVALGDQRFVRFEEVMLTNAPDVHVYLSKETGGKWSEDTSLYLGALKATNGSFNYEVPAGAELASYKSVVVWCRAFRVLISWADLS